MKLALSILILLFVVGCSKAPNDFGVITNIARAGDTRFLYSCVTEERLSTGIIWSSNAEIRFYSHKRFAIGDTVEILKRGGSK
jgi:hypothetical protein